MTDPDINGIPRTFHQGVIPKTVCVIDGVMWATVWTGWEDTFGSHYRQKFQPITLVQ